MTTIVKAADAAHFLSLLPAMLGFTPVRSLVLVPFRGSRSIGALRLDLPRDGTDLDAFAATCLGMVCRVPRADALAAAVFSDESCMSGLPGSALLASIGRAADACGLRITDALSIGSDGWGSTLDADCPRGGRPLEALALPVPVTTAPGDQTTGSVLPPVHQKQAEAVASALRAVRTAARELGGAEGEGPPRRGRPRIHPEALAAVGRLDDVVACFEQSLDTDPAALAPFEAALLVWCLSRPALRDVAIVQWAADARRGIRALDAQRRWEEGADYPSDLAMTMWGDGPQPDPARLTRALELTRRLAALAPPAARPGALATCAWLSWALGRSTHADLYARMAAELDPDHGLTQIVLAFVAAGHLPDWAFRAG
ncbi:DUF4192 domain-containing protein [Microbacterium sp. zg.Y909]|uniref:DUF4192 domain-containing protein n=1 Tax=Microbacterium sp. zg.Y909 TaxID=2969413 RepID=UPI00214C60C3|nr:DUF4192 domain-containing protein [Microbacterium sp. zg.Y909]MCR2825522.1 DUF4192 domain-containing protein [Microbacterium sp. zg.Y909]